jgi:predicted ATP-grasp superfamily ATP-dependent carboligase
MVPTPTEHPSGFVDALSGELSRERYALAVIAGDASLLAASRYREQLEGHLERGLGFPLPAAVEASTDKIALLSAATSAELTPPRTVVCADQHEALAAAESVGYPVVLKPRGSVCQAYGRTWRIPSRRVDGPAALARRLPDYGSPCLIQQVEAGAVVDSCAGVYAGGRMLAFCFSRYRRTWPPEGGRAAFSETVPAPFGLEEKVTRLLDVLGWCGIFELELLERPDGSLAAIDFNPRPYGSLALAVRAGADLPAIWAAWLRGEAPAPVTARPGLRYRSEEADVRGVLRALRDRRIRRAFSLARPHRRVAHAHWQWDDPAPLAAWMAALAVRARGRVGGPRRE